MVTISVNHYLRFTSTIGLHKKMLCHIPSCYYCILLLLKGVMQKTLLKQHCQLHCYTTTTQFYYISFFHPWKWCCVFFSCTVFFHIIKLLLIFVVVIIIIIGTFFHGILNRAMGLFFVVFLRLELLSNYVE